MRTAFAGILLMALCAPALAQAPKAGDSFRDCELCPEMVAIPAGDFLMGSPDTEQDRDENEGPQRRVTIKPFALGKFELTVDQFAAFVAAAKYTPGNVCDVWQDGSFDARPGFSWRAPNFTQTGKHPAACLSWDDAKAYLAWLSAKTGKTYRLPSEAEWEYAARAGASTRFHFGDDDKDYCRHGNGVDATALADVPAAKEKGWDALPCGDGRAFTAPVGIFAPNAFGLHDTHGNVFEWVEDCWNDNFKGAPTDGSAWVSGDWAQRVKPGGAWGYPAPYLRIP